MLVKYFKDESLEYARRRRYRKFNFIPFAQEENKSILLGDGATTLVKTKSSNLANYVIIENTRWFVTSFIYMNGGQITMFLQRDVIGEKGIANCYGKIERGYTNSILKNRKELSLNEILKERIKIIPETFQYGNYSVNTHNNELWGIMYFVKPTELDPNTGEPYPEKVNINIPAFAPNYVEYKLIEDGTEVFSQASSNVYQKFLLRVSLYDSVSFNTVTVSYNIVISYSFEGHWVYKIEINRNYDVNDSSALRFSSSVYLPVGMFLTENSTYRTAEIIATRFAQNTVNGINTGIMLPSFPNLTYEDLDYDGQVVKDGSNFWAYSATKTIETINGNISQDAITTFLNNVFDFHNFYIPISDGTSVQIYPNGFSNSISLNGNSNLFSSSIVVSKKRYTRTLLSQSESGNLVLDTTIQLVDEPYSVLAFPLFDTIITSNTGTKFNIQKKNAFMIFNTVIQYLSGDSPYLVDAQIYPYSPILTGITSQINEYPFFKISSNSYTYNCVVNLFPYSDVKKEYIQRKYSLISPEQSGKFDFNFYDYITEINDVDGINSVGINISIKTSLKPFSIISSAVITPSLNSLKGITYNSDLRGSQPTSNGFECSLSSNAFETYKRQNSNYQQTFNLQKEELAMSHQTERVNEITSTVVNTLSATAMGAIAGGAMGGGTGVGAAIGAGIGGVAAGTTVGIASSVQVAQNDKLRAFEKNLQQQNFDMQIGTIKNLPNSINRISSFNEIILQDFWYVIEIYECSDFEKIIVDNYLLSYGYGIGIFAFLTDFARDGWFLRSTIVSSDYPPNLHNIAVDELSGGIYYYE